MTVLPNSGKEGAAAPISPPGSYAYGSEAAIAE